MPPLKACVTEGRLFPPLIADETRQPDTGEKLCLLQRVPRAEPPCEMSGDAEAGGRSCRLTLCGLTEGHSPECRGHSQLLGLGCRALGSGSASAPACSPLPGRVEGRL